MASRYEPKSKGSLYPPGEDVVMFPNSRTVYSPEGALREIYKRSLRDERPKHKWIDPNGLEEESKSKLEFKKSKAPNGLEMMITFIEPPVRSGLPRERLERSLKKLQATKEDLRQRGCWCPNVEWSLKKVKKSLADARKEEERAQKKKR